MDTSAPSTTLSFTAVYECVNVISSGTSSLPCSVYKRDREENIKIMNTLFMTYCIA